MSGDSVIVDEVRRRRSELSERYGHDLRRYGEHVRQLQSEHAERLVGQLTVVPSVQMTPKGGPRD